MKKILIYLILLLPLRRTEITVVEDEPDESKNIIQSLLHDNEFRVIVIIRSMDTDNKLFQSLTNMTNNLYYKTFSIQTDGIRTFNSK